MTPKYPAPDWFGQHEEIMFHFVHHIAGWDIYSWIYNEASEYFGIRPGFHNGLRFAPTPDDDFDRFRDGGTLAGFQEAIAFCQAHYNLSQ